MDINDFTAREEFVPQSTENAKVANEPQVINNKSMEAGVWQ